MIRHLGTAELFDMPGVIGSHFQFKFDGIDYLYAGTKIDTKGLTVKEALQEAHRQMELMLNDVHKERERLIANV